MSLVVLTIGLVGTTLLSLVVYRVNARNEKRLLIGQTRQAATTLQAAIPAVLSPLTSVVNVLAAGNGDRDLFAGFMRAYLAPRGPFFSASLWHVDGGSATPVLQLGGQSMAGTPEVPVRRLVAATSPESRVDVLGPLSLAGPTPRLGYVVPAAAGSTSWIVYAETALPTGRRATVEKGSPYSGLDFALYLGTTQTDRTMLERNSDELPLTGRTATSTIPFASSQLLLVARRTRPLAGALPSNLWWIFAIAGGVVTVASATTAERLVRRRESAERLAAEVEVLLGRQRGISETLQHALLPQTMPEIADVHIAVRYVPGELGAEIGGDWFDVIPLDDARFFFVVGDVSGRGVAAGTVMASLRFAIRAFVSEGHRPADVLCRLTGLLDVVADRRFATVLCGVVDVPRREVEVASAGHLPPLLDGEFIDVVTGPPIGVTRTAAYPVTRVAVPPRGTLLAYTDGLVERRGEDLDAGLERLRSAAGRPAADVERTVDIILTEILATRQDDDTAILGVQWLT